MPPPSLSTTTTIEVDRPLGAGRAGRCVSCRKATSPTSATVGSPDADRDADRGRHHAVDAVGAPVGDAPARRAGRAVPLEVAHRHRRRHDQLRAVGQRGEQRRGRRAGSVGSRDVRRAPRRSPPGRPPRPPATSSSHDGAGGVPMPCEASAVAHRVGSARRRSTHDSGRAVRVDPAPPGCDEHLVRAADAPATAPSDLRRRRLAEPQHDLGPVARRRATGARSDRIGVRRPCSDAGTRQPDRGSASTGQPSASARRGRRRRSPAPRPATITPPRRLEQVAQPAPASAGAGVARPPTACQGRRRLSAGRQRRAARRPAARGRRG